MVNQDDSDIHLSLIIIIIFDSLVDKLFKLKILNYIFDY